jgi:hypothetical protein
MFIEEQSLSRDWLEARGVKCPTDVIGGAVNAVSLHPDDEQRYVNAARGEACCPLRSETMKQTALSTVATFAITPGAVHG